MAGHRRSHVPGGRRVNVMVAFSEAEADLIRDASGRLDMALGAWVAEVALRAAEEETGVPGLPGVMRLSDEMRILILSYSQMAQYRAGLRAIGNNLNQLVRHANATGTVHAATAHVLERLTTLVDQSGEIIDLFRDSEAATGLLLRAAHRRTSRRSKSVPAPTPATDDDDDDMDEWVGQ